MQTPEAKRAWARDKRKLTRSDRIEGEDEHWLIVACTSCWAFFDVPKPHRGRLPKTCGRRCLGT